MIKNPTINLRGYALEAAGLPGTELEATYKIECRSRIEVNTDPQRRCYNGCHFSSELQWTAWEPLEYGLTQEKLDHKMTFWTELNDYAVSQRGASAKREFRALPEGGA